MEAEPWRRFEAVARENPMFVLPLPKGRDAFVTFLVQMQLPHVLFTLLEEYQKMSDRASPHLVLTHYAELLDDKGIVLVRGDVTGHELADRRGALWLAQKVAHFFGGGGGDHGLVQDFNHNPGRFSFAALRAACAAHDEQLREEHAAAGGGEAGGAAAAAPGR